MAFYSHSGHHHVVAGDVPADFIIIFRNYTKYIDIGEDMSVPDDFTQRELESGYWWRRILAGGIAGGLSRTSTAPLDRVKVFFQVQKHKGRIWESVAKMIKEGGLWSLWRGNGINVMKIVPESGLKFFAFEEVKRFYKTDDKHQLGGCEKLLAGSFAGVFSQTVCYPLEVLKTRLVLRNTGQYKGAIDAIRKIYSKEGIGSFYRGCIPNMIGVIPYAGIELTAYEKLQKEYLRYNTERPGFLVTMAIGATASTLGQVCSYPLALVKTRLQAQAVIINSSSSFAPGGVAAISATSLDSGNTMCGMFKKIWQSDGFFGLYRGMIPNFYKSLSAAAISFAVYEEAKEALGLDKT